MHSIGNPIRFFLLGGFLLGMSCSAEPLPPTDEPPVIAGARVVGQVAIGDKDTWPHAVAVDPVRERVYVAVTCSEAGCLPGSSDEVWVLDAVDLQIIKKVRVGDAPLGLGVDPESGAVYVASAGTGSIWVIDADDLSVRRKIMSEGAPRRVVVDGETGLLWVGFDQETARVAVISAETGETQASLQLDGWPNDIAIDSAADRARISVAGADGVNVDTKSLEVISRFPEGFAVAVAGPHQLVHLGVDVGDPELAASLLTIQDPDVGDLQAKASVDDGAFSVAADGTNRIAYVLGDRHVLLRNLSSLSEIERVAIPFPAAIAVDPEASRAYVVNRDRLFMLELVKR